MTISCSVFLQGAPSVMIDGVLSRPLFYDFVVGEGARKSETYLKQVKRCTTLEY